MIAADDALALLVVRLADGTRGMGGARAALAVVVLPLASRAGRRRAARLALAAPAHTELPIINISSTSQRNVGVS